MLQYMSKMKEHTKKKQRRTCEAKQFENTTERCFATKSKRSQMLCDDWKIKLRKHGSSFVRINLFWCVYVWNHDSMWKLSEEIWFVTSVSNYNEISFVYAMYFIFFDYFYMFLSISYCMRNFRWQYVQKWFVARYVSSLILTTWEIS